MRGEDKQRIIERYNRRLAEFGYDIRTMASGTEERRRLRYAVLTEVGLSSGRSVLDLGCGFGDFSAYLREQGIEAAYTGFDINPDLIAVAEKTYPGESFQVKDIQQEPFPDFDYIVSTSAFNLKLGEQDNYQVMEDILKTCYAHARLGVAVDFLSSYVDYVSPEAFHYEPEKIFALAKRITKRVCLRHDYPLYEFCVYLYPDFKGWRE